MFICKLLQNNNKRFKKESYFLSPPLIVYDFLLFPRFSVNLTCGKNPSASPDYAFHFNPRLEQRYMVRNSRLNGQWGNEETTSIVKFDFERNKKFLLNIFISQSEFLVSLNGRHICAFGFRVPLSKVTGIEVNGLVEVYGVEYKELKIYPEPIPENKTFTVVVGGRQDEVPETLMVIIHFSPNCKQAISFIARTLTKRVSSFREQQFFFY